MKRDASKEARPAAATADARDREEEEAEGGAVDETTAPNRRATDAKRARLSTDDQQKAVEDPILVVKQIASVMASNGHANHDATEEDNTERVAILDSGAQYGKVIDRRVRELSVLGEMLPLGTAAAQIKADPRYKAIIISGGPASVYAADAPQCDPALFDCGLPVFGICYGFQLLAKYSGGVGVKAGAVREDGVARVRCDSTCPIFKDLDPDQDVLLTHGDAVTDDQMATGYRVVARSQHHVAAIANDAKKLYGVQFHPEVDLTKNGVAMLRNFLFDVAKCRGDYTMGCRRTACIDEIRSIVGDKKVLVLVSGGVDSAVCAALCREALSAERVTAVHIDHGFMRASESDSVVASLDALGLKVHRRSCALDFALATEHVDDAIEPKRKTGAKTTDTLCRVTEPELKRRIIGNTFVRVTERTMRELGLKKEDYFLAQGTLRPDLIESASALASGHADAIKTHHNDTELVRQLRDEGRVIEPLKDFHKDEVRALGRSLGLPTDIVHRHPFPGPGLAIRILCTDGPFHCDDFRRTASLLQAVVRPELRSSYADEHVWLDEDVQRVISADPELSEADGTLTAALLPVRSVGVQGDARSYSYVAALASSSSSSTGEGQQSSPDAKIPWALLKTFARLIPQHLHRVNRVVYVLGGDIDQEGAQRVTRTFLTQDVIERVRQADRHATDVLFGRPDAEERNGHSSKSNGQENGAAAAAAQPKLKDCSKDVQQMPVVLVPIDFEQHATTSSSPPPPPPAPVQQLQPSGRRSSSAPPDPLPLLLPPPPPPPLSATTAANSLFGHRHSVCVRPFITADFMTGVPALPPDRLPAETLLEMERRILTHVAGISRVMIDLTPKPPGTTEWE